MVEKLDVGTFLLRETNILKGSIIDIGRVSFSNDRQFEQFERLVKQYFRERLSGILVVLKEAYPEIEIKENI